MKTAYMKKFACVLVALGLGLFASTASATEARMAALMDTPLVMDMGDIAEFPGMLTLYGDTGFLTVKPLAPGGNVGVFFGDKIVFGAWVLRDPRFDDVATAATIYTFANPVGLELPETYNIADLFVGLSNGFGIRASVSAGLETVEAIDGSDRDSTGSSALGFEVHPGYTLQTGTYQGDFGLGLSMSMYKIAIAGDDVYTAIPIPSVLLRHRSTIGNFAEPVNWVLTALVSRRDYSMKDDSSGDKGHVADWVSSVVVGPKFNLPSNFTVTTGLRGQFETRGGKLDGDKITRRFAIGAPGVILSAELYVREILAIRAGADYSVYWGTSRTFDPADNDVTGRLRVMGQRFGWSAGLGLRLGSFEIDGTLSQALILDGPDMIGGTSPGFLGMLSALYSWQ